MEKADPFAAIADPTRRYLIEELRRSPKTVNELAQNLPISRPRRVATSQNTIGRIAGQRDKKRHKPRL